MLAAAGAGAAPVLYRCLVVLVPGPRARVTGGSLLPLAAVALVTFSAAVASGFVGPGGLPWLHSLASPDFFGVASLGMEGGLGESHARLWVDDDDALGRRLPC